MNRERRQPTRHEQVAEWGRQTEESRGERCARTWNLELEVRLEEFNREHREGEGRS